jgi:asparagine synthase (glutamine-hydrolysing)
MDHIILKFTAEDYVGALEGFLRMHGQPFGDPAGLPLYLAVKRLPTDIEMILDGTGNDAYMGIPLGRTEEICLELPLLRRLALLLPPSISRLLPGEVGCLCERLRRPLREFFVSWKGWSEEEILGLFSLDPRLGHTELSRLSCSFGDLDGTELKTEVLCRIWEPDTAYRKAVQPANYLDLPISYPFADSRLADFFSTLPKALCFRGRVNKVLLREYMSHSLPEQTLAKPKGYFEFDTGPILRVDRTGAARKYVADTMSHRGYAQSVQKVSGIVRRYMRGDSNLRDRVYTLALLSTWLELRSKRVA